MNTPSLMAGVPGGCVRQGVPLRTPNRYPLSLSRQTLPSAAPADPFPDTP